MGHERIRLDALLVTKGLFPTRERAKAAIMAGSIIVDGSVEDKPGSVFRPDLNITVTKDTNPYVSRGGLKLEKALQHFEIVLEGMTALDIGASTGGFTDCILKHGASAIVCVDVGYGQLAWELRNDPRVTVMERTNARYLTAADFAIRFDFASVDVSFISLSKIFQPLFTLMKNDASAVCLIKPQFEAGRKSVGKKGVVRDPAVHAAVVERLMNTAAEYGFGVLGVTFSPLRGPEGNIEFLIHLGMPGVADGFADRDSYASISLNVVNDSRNYFGV